jgi:hypothetical protein
MGVIRVSWIKWPPHQGRSGTGYSAVLTLKEDKLKVAGFKGKLAGCTLQSWQSADYTIESIRPAEAKNCHF